MGLLAATLLLAAVPALGDQPAATATGPLALAREAFLDIQNDTLDRSTLTPALSADLTDSVGKGMAARIGPYGAPTEFVLRSKSDVDGVTTYVLRVLWPHANVDYVFGLDDKTQKIAKLYFRPGPG